jgi:hypothetical protein
MLSVRAKRFLRFGWVFAPSPGPSPAGRERGDPEHTSSDLMRPRRSAVFQVPPPPVWGRGTAQLTTARVARATRAPA